MQINISTRHGELSEATKEKISKKVEKLQRFFERLTAIDITVDLDKSDEPKIEIIVRAEHKQDFIAQYPPKDDKPSTRSVDLFGAVDQTVAKLEHQIKKHKEKIQNHNRTGAANTPE